MQSWQTPSAFEFISQERIVLQDDVNMVIAPGASGVLGILPRHAPLMAVIVPGELVVKKEGQEDRYYAVGGGFMEVRPDKVILLARSGESAEEIDLARAQEARQRRRRAAGRRRDGQRRAPARDGVGAAPLAGAPEGGRAPPQVPAARPGSAGGD